MADPAIRARNRASKQRGAGFEVALVNWLRTQGYKASRIARKGNQDEGDCEIDLGDTVIVVEAKAVAKISLPEFLAEADVESANYARARGMDPSKVLGLVVIKRRNHGIDKSYAVIELDTLLSRFIGL